MAREADVAEMSIFTAQLSFKPALNCVASWSVPKQGGIAF